MPVSRLLKSWAMPPASTASDSIRWARACASSRRYRSLTSRASDMTP